MAQDLNTLSLHSEYDGTDEIAVGNGNKLQITHIGFATLSSSSKSFTLTNVLCVPQMTRNLLSVSKFGQSNNLSIEFLPHCFLVKDLQTGNTLLKGPLRNGVYEWPIAIISSSVPTAYTSVKTTLSGLASLPWSTIRSNSSSNDFSILSSYFVLQ